MVYPKISEDNDNDENQKNHLKEMYEAEYAALVRNNKNFNYKYWRYLDQDRYYNELFMELDWANRMMDYPKLDEKIFLILAITGSFYFRAMNPDIYFYRFLSTTVGIFMFYFFMRDIFTLCVNGTSVRVIDVIFSDLNSLISKSGKNMTMYNKFRPHLLSLDNHQNKLNLKILILDICFYIIMIVLGIALMCIGTNNEKIRTLFFDAFCYFYGSILLIMFKCFHLKTCFDNLKWLEKLNQKLDII